MPDEQWTDPTATARKPTLRHYLDRSVRARTGRERLRGGRWPTGCSPSWCPISPCARCSPPPSPWGPRAASCCIAVVRPLVADSAELHDRYEAAVADSLTDPLTGIGNHRAFQEELDRQVEQAHRYGVPVSLMLLDIDEFKSINDQPRSRGRRSRPRGLRPLSSSRACGGWTARSASAGTSSPCFSRIPTRRGPGSWGAVCWPQRSNRRCSDQGTTAISFSAGVSSLPELGTTREQLYSQADAALYAAKRGGRTDVVLFDPSATVAEPTSAAGAASSR